MANSCPGQEFFSIKWHTHMTIRESIDPLPQCDTTSVVMLAISECQTAGKSMVSESMSRQLKCALQCIDKGALTPKIVQPRLL